MIYFHVALPFEGDPFIKHYRMKLFAQTAGSKIYKTEDDTGALVTSGVGDFKASAAVSSMFTMFPCGKKDLFVNFGIAGSRDTSLKIGEIVRCVKTTRQEERSIFPDIIFETKNEYKYVSVETVVGVAKPGDVSENIVVDNEAYGALFSSNLFLPSENCFSFKVISDYVNDTYFGGNQKLDMLFVKKLCFDVSEKVIEEISYLKDEIAKKTPDTCKSFSETELVKIRKIEENYKITYAVKEIFENLIWRDKCIGIDINKSLDVILTKYDVSENVSENRDTFSKIIKELSL